MILLLQIFGVLLSLAALCMVGVSLARGRWLLAGANLALLLVNMHILVQLGKMGG